MAPTQSFQNSSTQAIPPPHRRTRRTATSTPNNRRSSTSPNNNNDDRSTSTIVTFRMGDGERMRVRVTLAAIDAGTSPTELHRLRVRSRSVVDAESRVSDDTTSATMLGRNRHQRRNCNHIYDRAFCSKCHIRRRHMCRWFRHYRPL